MRIDHDPFPRNASEHRLGAPSLQRTRDRDRTDRIATAADSKNKGSLSGYEWLVALALREVRATQGGLRPARLRTDPRRRG